MSPLMRRIFWFINKYFMVPIFRLGLGPLFDNPFSGYIMVMKTVGRKSGKTRYVPVNYAIHQGHIYCVSGGRKNSDWYRNIKATPEIDVILPGGAIHGRVEEISDPEMRRVVVRQILQNAGFAGFFEGYNPFRVSDDELAAKSADLPLLRIQPIGLGSGAFDPGGWAWIWVFIITLAIILMLVLR
jgi:deazaflavin-dependent oxidoreductase (nitroreductase family)